MVKVVYGFKDYTPIEGGINMNQYGALELLTKLGMKELNFKTKHSYEQIKPNLHILYYISGPGSENDEYYYCKDETDYHNKYPNYSWDTQCIYYFYDQDTDAVVIELLMWGTDVDEVETLDQLYAIVRKDFLEAYGIKLVFGKEDKDDY